MRVRLWIVIAFAIVIAGIAGGFELAVWSWRTLSTEFTAKGRSAFIAIERCQQSVEEPGETYKICTNDATKTLAEAYSATRSVNDRRVYLFLERYLKVVSVCRQDWQSLDKSGEAGGGDTRKCFGFTMNWRSFFDKGNAIKQTKLGKQGGAWRTPVVSPMRAMSTTTAPDTTTPCFRGSSLKTRLVFAVASTSMLT